MQATNILIFCRRCAVVLIAMAYPLSAHAQGPTGSALAPPFSLPPKYWSLYINNDISILGIEANDGVIYAPLRKILTALSPSSELVISPLTQRIDIKYDAHQPSASFMTDIALLSKRGSSARALNVDSENLIDAPSFDVVVEELAGDGPPEITTAEVRSWVLAELARSAPTAIVGTPEYAPSTHSARATDQLAGYIAYWDATSRWLYININMVDDNAGGYAIHVTVKFVRNGILPSGSTMVSVFEKGSIGHFGSAVLASESLRNAVCKQVRKFADAWVIANKPARTSGSVN